MAPRGGRGGGGSRGGGADISVDVDLNSPAIVFAVLYGIMLLAFASKALAEPTSVVLFLVVFGAIRVAQLGMEAVIEDPNLGTLPISVATGALYDCGIFALLYSAYMLVIKRGIISGNVAKNPVTRITSNAHFFRSILAIGVVFGVASWVHYFQAINDYDGSSEASFLRMSDAVNVSWILQRVCVSVFLFATVILAVQTVFLLSAERARSPSQQQSTPGGLSEPLYAKSMPFLITVFLLVHQIFRLVTVVSTTPQLKLVAYLVGVLPEWLAVVLFAVKGVIPPRRSVVPPAPGHGKEFVLA